VDVDVVVLDDESDREEEVDFGQDEEGLMESATFFFVMKLGR
jgi:hypothetical protein